MRSSRADCEWNSMSAKEPWPTPPPDPPCPGCGHGMEAQMVCGRCGHRQATCEVLLTAYGESVVALETLYAERGADWYRWLSPSLQAQIEKAAMACREYARLASSAPRENPNEDGER